MPIADHSWERFSERLRAFPHETSEFSTMGEPDYDRVDEELQSQLRNPEMWEGPMEESGVEW